MSLLSSSLFLVHFSHRLLLPRRRPNSGTRHCVFRVTLAITARTDARRRRHPHCGIQHNVEEVLQEEPVLTRPCQPRVILEELESRTFKFGWQLHAQNPRMLNNVDVQAYGKSLLVGVTGWLLSSFLPLVLCCCERLPQLAVFCIAFCVDTCLAHGQPVSLHFMGIR